MKPQRLHFGLLVAGAVAVILWLLYEKQQQDAAGNLPNNDIAPPPGMTVASSTGYPNIPQIQPQNFDVTGAAPNALPNVPVGGYQVPTYTISNPSQSATPGGTCSCEEDSCDSAGQPVTSQLIPGWVVNQGAANVSSFQYKLSG